MKVTAIIEDELIDKVKKATGGKNITESIVIALQSYLNQHTINFVIDEIEREPLMFAEGYTAMKVRNSNRKR